MACYHNLHNSPCLPVAHCSLNSNYRQWPSNTFWTAVVAAGQCNQCDCGEGWNTICQLIGKSWQRKRILRILTVLWTLAFCRAYLLSLFLSLPLSSIGLDLRLYSPRDGSWGHACASGCDVCGHAAESCAWNDTRVHRHRPAIKNREGRQQVRVQLK